MGLLKPVSNSLIPSHSAFDEMEIINVSAGLRKVNY